MAEDDWHQARLIPTSGISGPDEAERRATSALLAVMSAVREFGAAITKPLGAPSGQLETYIEVPFDLDDRRCIPDGLLRARRGGKTWTYLVEVKTGTNELQTAQVESYLDVARAEGFDGVLTISNQIAHAPGVHPTTVDKRKLRKAELHHLSWSEILAAAVQQRVYRGVADPDQAWILSELIRYLQHPKSGALDFSDMSDSWTSVRDSVTNHTLRASDKGLLEVVMRWEQLLRFTALQMGRELGVDVQVVLGRKEQADPNARITQQCHELVEHGRFSGSLRIPGAVGDLAIVADLRANRVNASVEVDAPKEGRQNTRVNWLLRQLTEAPKELRLESWVQNSRQSLSELLRDCREFPDKLVLDPKKDIRMFRLTASANLGSKRGRGRGSFIDAILDTSQLFYGQVVQGLRPWTPRAPQLPDSARGAIDEVGIDVAAPRSDFTQREWERLERADGNDPIAAAPSVTQSPFDSPPAWLEALEPPTLDG